MVRSAKNQHSAHLEFTQPRLTESDVAKISSVKSILVNVQNITDVPWEALAAVWYRESLSLSTSNAGGPFQFDPPPSESSLYNLLKRFLSHKLSDTELRRMSDAGVSKFDIAATAAACTLRSKVGPRVTVDATDELIKDMLYGYNGRAYGDDPENSPYVFNQHDADHQNMVLVGTTPDPKSPGGRRYIRIKDHRLGAFVVYRQLKGLDA